MTASNFGISAGGVSVFTASHSIVDVGAEIAVVTRVVALVTCSASPKFELISLEVGSVATTRRPDELVGVEEMMLGKGGWSGEEHGELPHCVFGDKRHGDLPHWESGGDNGDQPQ